MEVPDKFILQESETLNDFPDKSLKVEDNSNYYYTKINDKVYITRRQILSIDYKEDDITIVYGYHSVMNDKLVSVIKKKITILKTIIENKSLIVVPLSKVLNIKGNDVYYLGIDDVRNIVGFDKQKTKTIKKN